MLDYSKLYQSEFFGLKSDNQKKSFEKWLLRKKNSKKPDKRNFFGLGLESLIHQTKQKSNSATQKNFEIC